MDHPGILKEESSRAWEPESPIQPVQEPKSPSLFRIFLPMYSGGIHLLSQSCPRLFTIALANSCSSSLFLPSDLIRSLCIKHTHIYICIHVCVNIYIVLHSFSDQGSELFELKLPDILFSIFS